LTASLAGPWTVLRAQEAATAREDLFRAIRRDDPHALRTALLRGADPNALDEQGEPALVLATRMQVWRAARALAELRGTRLNAVNQVGSTAVMYAALHGQYDLVQFLVERKAEINKPGWTALHFGAANGHVQVVRFLLERHAYIDAESPNGTTPLMMAARQGQATVARLLLDEGADPTPRNQSGFDAAAYARAAGNPELAAYLAQQADAYRRKYGRPSK
jgi:ankyrin repeat protein